MEFNSLHRIDENITQKKATSERGSVSIETVFYIIIFAVTFFGGVELARGIALRNALDTGTWEAARYLSVTPGDWAGADNIIRQSVSNSPLGSAYAPQVSVSVNMPSSAFSSPFSVRASVPFQATIPLVGGLTQRTIQTEHTLRIEAYP